MAFESHHGYDQIYGGQRMNDAKEIHSGHPLFRELRKDGLLWHCTSPEELLQIRTCGFIKPNERLDGKYGKLRSACQALDSISLFDFTTESEARVLDTPYKWQQFLGCAKPLTVILGLKRNQLPGRVVPYPENRDITSHLNCGGPIPWVEVCHYGQIPISAITLLLLVCAADYRRFRPFENLSEAELQDAITECAGVKDAADKKFDLEKINQSPEFKARMTRARLQIEKAMRQT